MQCSQVVQLARVSVRVLVVDVARVDVRAVFVQFGVQFSVVRDILFTPPVGDSEVRLLLPN